MGGRRRRTAVVSLRHRALAALAIGSSVLAALGVFEAADAHALSDAEARLATYRTLESDNLALASGMNTQAAGLATYVQALTLEPATLRELGDRDTLLGDYVTGSGQVRDSLSRLQQESAQLGIGAEERPVASTARAWQAWAQGRRDAAEAAAGHPLDPRLDAEGSARRSVSAAFRPGASSWRPIPAWSACSATAPVSWTAGPTATSRPRSGTTANWSPAAASGWPWRPGTSVATALISGAASPFHRS